MSDTFTSQLPLAPNMSPLLAGVMSNLDYHLPFYGYLLTADIVWVSVPADHPVIRTAATDCKRIWVNDGFLASLTPKARLLLLCHELEHVVGMDVPTSRQYAKSGFVPSFTIPGKSYRADQHQMNIAQDAIHNGNLSRNPLMEMPVNPDTNEVIGILMPDKVDLSNHTWQHVYEILQLGGGQPGGGQPGDGQPGGGQPGGGQPGDGQPGDGQLDIHVTDDMPGAADPDDPVEQTRIEQILSAAAESAERRKPGSTPAHMRGRLTALAGRHKVDWKQHMREFLTRALRGPSKPDWTRIDRRRLQTHGLVVPPRYREQCPPIAAIIDTSGSTAELRDQFLAELLGLALEAQPAAITLVFVDTQVQRIEHFESADAFAEAATSLDGVAFPRGGGTSLAPGYRAVAALLPAPVAVVTLTDSEVWDWLPEAPLPPPAVWLTVTSDPTRPHPDWQTVIGL